MVIMSLQHPPERSLRAYSYSARVGFANQDSRPLQEKLGFLARQQALQVYKRPWPRYTCTAYICPFQHSLTQRHDVVRRRRQYTIRKQSVHCCHHNSRFIYRRHRFYRKFFGFILREFYSLVCIVHVRKKISSFWGPELTI